MMSRYFALSVFLALLIVINGEHQYGVCKFSYCDCSAATHPSWITVNCTVPHDQHLNLHEGDLPETTNNLFVNGAEAVMISMNALSRLQDIRQISITNTKLIVIRKFAAVNLNVVSLYLEIEDCDVLRVEERTFSNIKGPLSAVIRGCEYVQLEGETFSWLLSVSIINVKTLQVGSGAFTLDPTAANVGEHGPGMTIEMKNVTVPELPSQTFGSSAARITLESVNIHGIRSGAFSANTYNIVMAVNCTFHIIEEEAFAQKSLINNLHFYGCKIHQLATKALQSAVSNLKISHTRLENINTGAINATVATVVISDSEFNNFMEKGFVLAFYDKLQMERNSFDDLAPNAIVGPGASIQELIFVENEIETIHSTSLAFIGQAEAHSPDNIVYKNNYYGQPCHCNVTSWLTDALGSTSIDPYISESYCTVNEFFARCFNVPEQNMILKKFIESVCTDKSSIQCETYKNKGDGTVQEIKNPRFPHKNKQEDSLSDRDKKIIGIVVVTCLGCVIIAMFVTFVRWMRRRGYCVNLKNLLISSNSSCGLFCDRICSCTKSNGLDDTRSVSRISVNEYSERHRLNEPQTREIIQESNLIDEIVRTDDKTTQTLPEELTRELLVNLKKRLDICDTDSETREMIEHLYDLTKIDDSPTLPTVVNENIYDLPFQNTTSRLGKNNKQMTSVGTRVPSLDKLLPHSPYNGPPTLAHDYFQPRDLVVHLYAEITNNDRENRNLLGDIPDVLAEQVIPRGPYLRAVREKLNSSASSTPSITSPSSSVSSPFHMSIKSSTSTTSDSLGKMKNRPLPAKPSTSMDPGEGTSSRQG